MRSSACSRRPSAAASCLGNSTPAVHSKVAALTLSHGVCLQQWEPSVPSVSRNKTPKSLQVCHHQLPQLPMGSLVWHEMLQGSSLSSAMSLLNQHSDSSTRQKRPPRHIIRCPVPCIRFLCQGAMLLPGCIQLSRQLITLTVQRSKGLTKGELNGAIAQLCT